MYPHLFRQTFISWTKADGMTDFEIAAVTGHVVAGDSASINRVYAAHSMAGPVAADVVADRLWR